MRRYITLILLLFHHSAASRIAALNESCSPSDPNFCVSIIKKNETFLGAAEECKALGMSLLSIENENQQNFAIAAINKTAGIGTHFWFGFHSVFDRYRWMSNALLVNTFMKTDNLSEYRNCFSITAENDSLYTWTPNYCNSKLWFVCSSKSAQTAPTVSAEVVLRKCPDNFSLIDTHCFYTRLNTSDPLTWDKSSEFCSKLTPNGTLASISSIIEQDYISVSSAESSYPIWIGMQQIRGEHQWISGENITFTNWMPREPSSARQRRCTAMHLHPNHFGEWKDIDCSQKLAGFVCQAPALPSPVSPPSGITQFLSTRKQCALGFFEYRNRCYMVLQKRSAQNPVGLNHEGQCKHRLAPHSSEELAMMRLMLHNSSQSTLDMAWIGISLLRGPDRTTTFESEDGLPVSRSLTLHFSNLPLSEIQATSSRDCLALSRHGAGLIWINCTTELPSICGYPLPGYELATANTSAVCPEKWHAFGKKCFSDLSAAPRTWHAAELQCNELHEGGHLVSVHSRAEHQFVSNLASHQRAWLGLRVQLPNPLARDPHFHWSDESLFDYMSFAVGQPSMALNTGYPEECVVLQDKTQDWNDVSCYDRHPYVCQITMSEQAVDSASHTTPSIILKEPCFFESALNIRICMELHMKPATFFNAQSECQSSGKSLVTIVSKDHQQFIMDQLKQLHLHSTINVSVGLFSSNGRWMWSSGYNSLPSTFWAPGHPSGNQSCVRIDSGIDGLSTWKVGSCGELLPFLCGDHLPPANTPNTNFEEFECPASFTRIGSHCFLVNANVDTHVTWSDAASLCAKTTANAKLATIRSSHEQDGLTTLLALQSHSAWIGLRVMEGVHSWISGEPVVYTHWDVNEPSVIGSRCTAMGHQYDNLGDWLDLPCDQRMGYICQADPIRSNIAHPELLELDGLLQPGRCSSGFFEYRDQCFAYSLPPQPLSRGAVTLRDSVSDQCATLSPRTGVACGTAENPWATAKCPVVATPHTSADAAFLRVLLGRAGSHLVKNAWIGIKFMSTKDGFNISSEDGSLLGTSSLINFESRLLNGTAVQEKPLVCSTISTLSSHVSVTDCASTGLPIFCGYFLVDHPLHPSHHVTPAAHCPPGWSEFQSRCYYSPPVETHLDWVSAEEFCQHAAKRLGTSDVKFSGHLASIHSLEMQHFLSDLAASSSLWVGLRSTLSFDEPSVAVHNVSQHLYWSDRSPVDYLSVLPNEWNLIDDLSTCFSLVFPRGHWHQTECYQIMNFVCQLSVSELVEAAVQRADTKPPPTPCDQTFPLQSPSGGACYRIIESNVTWPEAEGFCRNLLPGAHLVSVHSDKEYTDLLSILSGHVSAASKTWIGLRESELAYVWSDETPVNFVPSSADSSKNTRHLIQDCFAIIPQPIPSMPLALKLEATSCSSRLNAFVCQREPPSLGSSKVASEPSSWKPVLCPNGYRQYADRCFALLPTAATWNQSNNMCKEIAAKFRGYSGSLARIDSVLLQDFLSSLLDDLPAHMSSAWIGLQRSFSTQSPSIHWSDGVPVNFLRPTYRSAVHSAFNDPDSTTNNEMCTAMFRSTHPRLNGLWLQWSCNEAVQLPAICQAVPPNGMNVESVDVRYPSPNCPAGFTLGSTGFSSDRTKRLSHPVCYRLLSLNEKVSWEVAGSRCKALSTDQFDVHLLSIASVFESNFLRSWLRMPRSLGGAGLSADEPVWSGLRVTQDCPACYSNWSWNAKTYEPVRYTDWLSPPSSNPSGCYLFHTNPYQSSTSLPDTNLGSLRLAESCSSKYLAVCQTSTHPPDDPAPSRQLIRPVCGDLGDISSPGRYYLRQNMSQSGKVCVRWDLVSLNASSFQLDLGNLHRQLSSSDVVGGEGVSSYAENYCSVLYNHTTKASQFGCYVNLYPIVFEQCNRTECPSTVSTSRAVGPVGTFFLVVFFLVLLAVLMFATWRCRAPIRAGYTRYFDPPSVNPKRKMTVHFYMPTNQSETLNVNALPQSPNDASATNATFNSKSPQSLLVPVSAPQVPGAPVGYMNPFHNEAAFPVFDDDDVYESEQEI